jgi:hypothetical protein
MQRSSLTVAAVASFVFILSGCASIYRGIISCSGSGCGGGGLFDPEPPPAIASVPITLAFKISTADGVTPSAGTIAVTKDRATQFLNIGVAEFSRNYGMSPNSWQISFGASAPTDDDVVAVLGVTDERAPISRDRSIHAFLKSPPSPPLTASEATPIAVALMKSDQNYSPQREYRVSFKANVVATNRPEIPNALFFDVSLRAFLDGKSKFADDDAYTPVAKFDQSQSAAWQGMIENELFVAYVKALRALGLKVEPRSPK